KMWSPASVRRPPTPSSPLPYRPRSRVFRSRPPLVDDFYWRGDTRTVLSFDGTRLGDHHDWIEQGLVALNGDVIAFWNRHRESGLRFSEWCGIAVFAFAPSGPGVADFVQVALKREHEFLAGPVVDPNDRPFSADDLFHPSWVKREPETDAPVLAG